MIATMGISMKTSNAKPPLRVTIEIVEQTSSLGRIARICARVLLDQDVHRAVPSPSGLSAAVPHEQPFHQQFSNTRVPFEESG